MIIYYGKLDIYSYSAERCAVEIDISGNAEHCSVLLDALEYRLIKCINIKDEQSKHLITLRIDEKAEFSVDSHELRLTAEQIQLIKKLICDVSIGNAFPGYHTDLEIQTKNGIADLCVVLTDRNGA